jgi:hypothetical protein
MVCYEKNAVYGSIANTPKPTPVLNSYINLGNCKHMGKLFTLSCLPHLLVTNMQFTISLPFIYLFLFIFLDLSIQEQVNGVNYDPLAYCRFNNCMWNIFDTIGGVSLSLRLIVGNAAS